MTLIDNERPAYRILAYHGFFGPDDHLRLEGEEIYYDGEPNEEMEPLNEPARKRLQAYLENLDQLGREAAAKAGKAYAGRARSLDGQIALATAIQRAEMKIMGADKDVQSIASVNDKDAPETGSMSPEKRGRGRPRKTDTIASVAAA